MPEVAIALGLSLKVAGTAVALNAVLAVGLAYLFAKYNFWGKSFWDAVLTLPLVLPPTIIGYYLIVLLGRNSVLGEFLQHYFGITLLFTWQGAVIAAMVVSFPLIFKPARSAFESVNPAFIQAARSLGAGSWRVFFCIALPLAMNGISAGILLSFARCLGEFGATLMIAGNIPGKTQTLSLAVYQAVQVGQDEYALQLVLLTSAICVAVSWLAHVLGKSNYKNRL